MAEPIAEPALDTLFRDARTQNGWRDTPVAKEMLVRLYDLVKWGPTSANIQPMRVKFLTSREAKEKLKPHLSAGNADKTMTAPVVAIIGYDLEFYEHLPRIFPHNQTAKSWFEGKPDHIQATAFRNGSLQGGYFILAARAVGLDCGPMSGFDAAGVDAAFWAGTKVKTNFLCSLGHGDPAKIFPRSPRFAFDEVCEIL
ncbi:malonic semialdehyde reductase [Elioraea rosea]|uniref:malonic semialdehyde reductase n=1 Tax=Elioraea rosea TaxID=2492390 RepID=UPI00118203DE|nr:malonic semialdehyde reductase [Elioraea rosea]